MTEQTKVPAHFFVCPCNQHGRIYTARGLRSSEITFKAFGRHLIRTAVMPDREQLSLEEVPIVMREIMNSPLPEGPHEVDLLLLYRTQIYNNRVAEDPTYQFRDSEKVHRFLTTFPVKTEDIPESFLHVIKVNMAKLQPN